MGRDIFRARVLLVCTSQKAQELFYRLLPDDKIASIKTASSCAEARSSLMQEGADICLINTPLPDGNGVQLASFAAKDCGAAVLLFIKKDGYDNAGAATGNAYVFVAEKPNSEHFFRQALSLLFTAKQKTWEEESKLSSLRDKLDEVKIVNRAKLVLIQYLKMDESTAHRYIEKQAMDRRVTRREVAESILSAYEYGFEWK